MKNSTHLLYTFDSIDLYSHIIFSGINALEFFSDFEMSVDCEKEEGRFLTIYTKNFENDPVNRIYERWTLYQDADKEVFVIRIAIKYFYSNKIEKFLKAFSLKRYVSRRIEVLKNYCEKEKKTKVEI